MTQSGSYTPAHLEVENKASLHAQAEGSIELIPRFHEDRDSVEAMTATLEEHGVIILERGESFRTTTLPGMLAQLEPLLASVEPDPPGDFYASNTKRILGLVSRMDTVQPFVMDKFSLALAEFAMKDTCERIQLHVAIAICPGPGSTQQVLHRDDDAYPHLKHMMQQATKGAPMPNLILNSMTALIDFLPENGATLVVPGSHQWPLRRRPLPHEIVAAEMPAGSTLYWLGGTFHGAGPNTTEDVYRASVTIAYNCGWLRQEENQILQVPPEVADTLPVELRSMLGYSMHGEALGYYDKRLAKSKYSYVRNDAKRKMKVEAKL